MLFTLEMERVENFIPEYVFDLHYDNQEKFEILDTLYLKNTTTKSELWISCRLITNKLNL